MFLAAGLLTWAAAAAMGADPTGLKAVAADRYFIVPGQPAVVVWKAQPGQASRPIDYTIRDYHDQPVSSGQAQPGADGDLTARVSLAQGCYELEFPSLKQRFGIVVLPPFAGRPDPLFGIDGALSWLERRDDVREGLIAALRRSGVGIVRERLSWDRINPAADRWDWEDGPRFEKLRQMYARQQMGVLEMFHAAPAWAGRVEKYPDDLPATARAWQQIARRWRPTWSALEVWNEPDISFGGLLPADQYVPLVKAIAYGLAQERIDVPLVGGVFAKYQRTFLDTAAANGLADGLDAVSFHTYSRAPQMEPLVRKYREWLAICGREALPLWITECGRPWRRGPDRPPADQAAASALDITMKAVEARACGVARYFAFVYPFYEERLDNFGMLGREVTPLRAMGAYAQCIRVLSGKRYLGDLGCDDPAVQRARVFGDDQETLAVLYTGRIEAGAKAGLAVPVLRVEGIDGRALIVTPQASGAVVPIPDGLTYVWLERGKLGARLQPDSPAMRLWKLGQADPPARAAPSPIVLRHQFDRSVLCATSDGYRLAAQSPGEVPLTVRAFNLGPQPQGLELQVQFSRAGARILDGPLRSVRVPAGGFADVAWKVDLSGAFAPADRLGVTVTAAGPEAGRGARLAFDLIGEAPWSQVLERYAQRSRLPVQDLARWHAQIARASHMTMAVAPEGHCRLEARFGVDDRWVYPRFRLPDGLDLSRWTALLFRARCQRPATVRVFLWEGDHGVGYLTPQTIVPADGQWHTAKVRFEELILSTANAPDPNGRLDLDQVRQISIGMNSQAAENTLEFSEVYVVGEPP